MNTVKRPPNAGKGRGKGAQNKITKELKEMILGALDDAGGQAYLKQQATENPSAFLSLVGKIVPKDVNNNISGDANNPITIIKRVIVDGTRNTDS